MRRLNFEAEIQVDNLTVAVASGAIDLKEGGESINGEFTARLPVEKK
jgi:hypothetical protein